MLLRIEVIIEYLGRKFIPAPAHRRSNLVHRGSAHRSRALSHFAARTCAAATMAAASSCCKVSYTSVQSDMMCSTPVRLRQGPRPAVHQHRAASHATASTSRYHAAAPANRSRSRLYVAAGGSPPDVSTSNRARLAVFVSGGGSNFKAIHAACLDKRINADIVVRGCAECSFA